MPIMARTDNGEYKEISKIVKTDDTEIEAVYDADNRAVYYATHEVEGEPPLTYKGHGKDLKDYKLYGNTVQNGEPSPDNPVEVVGVGERTVNLFDYEKIQTGYRVIWSTGEPYADNTAIMSDYISVASGFEYSTNIAVFFLGYSENKEYMGVYNQDSNSFVEAYSPTTDSVIIPNGCKFIKLLSFVGYSTISPNTMLTPGATAPDHYIPYGYEAVVETRGVNLFDYRTQSNSTVINSGNGNPVFGGPNYKASDYIPIVGDSAYYISGNNWVATNGGAFYDDDKQFISGITTRSPHISPSNAKYVRFTMYRVDGTGVMLTTGTTPPSHYEPYHEPITTPIYIGNEPLHKIGDYADYVDYKRGVVVMRIKKLVLTGEEDIRLVSGNAPFCLDTPKLKLPNINEVFWKCNHYISVANSASWAAYNYLLSWSTMDSTQLRFRDTRFSTITDFKSFLSTQYEAGTPVTIWYVLAEPEEIPLDNLNPIPTINGTNILSVETDVNASNVWLKGKIKALPLGGAS